MSSADAPKVVPCPACLQQHGGTCRQLPSDFDGGLFDCQMCGRFKISGTALAKLTADHKLSSIQRAALCHLIRSTHDHGSETPLMTANWLDEFLQNARL